MWDNQFLLFDKENPTGRLINFDQLVKIMENAPGLDIGSIQAGMMINVMRNSEAGCYCIITRQLQLAPCFVMLSDRTFLIYEKEDPWPIN